MKFITLFFSSLLFCSVSLAGGTIIGDGGHGVHCPGINRLEFLDLYEARRTLSFIPTGYESQNLLDDYDGYRIMKKIFTKQKRFFSKHLGDNHAILPAFDRALESFYSVRSDRFIDTTDDLGATSVKISKGCKIVQFAIRSVFNGKERIEIDRELLNYLPAIDLAALLLHEALHPYFENEKSTVAVRRLVGFIFANKEYRERNIAAIKTLLP